MVSLTAILAGAGALWVGVPIGFVVVALAGWAHPVLAVSGLAAFMGVARLRPGAGPSPDEEAAFLAEVAAELLGGASPRLALVHAGRRASGLDPARLIRVAELGLDARYLAEEIGRMLPFNGRLAGAAFSVAGVTGSPLGPVAEVLAQRAARRGRLIRERSALTAQARATAWLIAGLPFALIGFLLVSGRIGSGASVGVLALGLGLQAAGLAIVVGMLRGRR